MDYQERINELIDAKTAASNCLAMQFMLNILNLSFEEAFAKLKLANQEDELISLSIAEIQIIYKVSLQRIIYVPSSYADIERSIIYKGKLEPNSTLKLFADNDSILDLGEFGPVENLQVIQDDIKELCPYIEALYVQMMSN